MTSVAERLGKCGSPHGPHLCEPQPTQPSLGLSFFGPKPPRAFSKLPQLPRLIMRHRGSNLGCTGSREEGSAPVRSPLPFSPGPHRESIGVDVPRAARQMAARAFLIAPATCDFLGIDQMICCPLHRVPFFWRQCCRGGASASEGAIAPDNGCSEHQLSGRKVMWPTLRVERRGACANLRRLKSEITRLPPRNFGGVLLRRGTLVNTRKHSASMEPAGTKFGTPP